MSRIAAVLAEALLCLRYPLKMVGWIVLLLLAIDGELFADIIVHALGR